MGHTVDDSNVVLMVLIAFTFGLVIGVYMAKSSMKNSNRQSLLPPKSKESGTIAARSATAVPGAHVELPPEVVALLPRQKIEAIKKYREITGVGLKEAKSMIDAYCAQAGI